jgi:hypothetical protein
VTRLALHEALEHLVTPSKGARAPAGDAVDPPLGAHAHQDATQAVTVFTMPYQVRRAGP